MKTVFVNCSPKKRFCASSYFLGLQRLFVRGEKVTEKLRGKGDHQRILQELSEADAVVFCLPLYVDGLPSHVLPFLKEMERFCRENQVRLDLYSISNNGFIEGNQSEPLLQVFQNFCARSGLNWCGGMGIGGGVMLNVTRILFLVQVGLPVSYTHLVQGDPTGLLGGIGVSRKGQDSRQQKAGGDERGADGRFLSRSC